MSTQVSRTWIRVLGAASFGLLLPLGFAAAEEISFDVSLSSPGDSDGQGEGTVTIDSATNQVSWDLSYSNIAEPSAMHIHEGAAGQSGGVVVPLTVGTDQEGNLVGLTNAPAEVVEAILASPGNYYVNIHNPEHPRGAIRGQLGE